MKRKAQPKTQPGLKSVAMTGRTLILGIAGFKHSQSGFPLTTDCLSRLELPHRFSAADIQRMRKDVEALANVLREHPIEMKRIFEAYTQNQILAAQRIAQSIGLTEEGLTKQGGGIIFAL